MSDFTVEQADAILSRSWKSHLLSYDSDGSLTSPIDSLDKLLESVADWLGDEYCEKGPYGSAGCIEAFRQALGGRYGYSLLAEAMNTKKNTAVCSIISACGFAQAMYKSIESDGVVKGVNRPVEHLSAFIEGNEAGVETLRVEFA